MVIYHLGISTEIILARLLPTNIVQHMCTFEMECIISIYFNLYNYNYLTIIYRKNFNHFEIFTNVYRF